MKRKLFLFVVTLSSLFFCSISNAQINKSNKKEPVDWRIKLDTLSKEFNVSTDTSKLTSEAVLNVFFTNQINSYLSKSGDLNLSKAYAVLDQSDGRLFIGGSWTSAKAKTDKLSNILTIGVKLDVEDNKAAIFNSKNNLENNIGIALKFTHVGKGTIWMTKGISTSQIEELKLLRKMELEILHNEIDEESSKIMSKYEVLSSLDTSKKNESLNRAYKKLYTAKRLESAEKEADIIQENKLFTNACNWWLSADGYIPLSKSEYNISSSISSNVFNLQEYYQPEGRLTFGAVYTNPWLKAYGRAYGSIIRNNSVSTKQLTKYTYNQFLSQAGGDTLRLAELESDKVYVGDFNTFFTYRWGGEFTAFPFNDYVGISLSIERYFGGNSYVGWNKKIGIPVSLKDKDNKPKVNFELQLAENVGKRFFGLSVGLPIGSVLYE